MNKYTIYITKETNNNGQMNHLVSRSCPEHKLHNLV